MRPSDRYSPALRAIGAAAQAVLAVAVRCGDADRAAVEYLATAIEQANEWRKSTRETERREAYGAALTARAFALTAHIAPRDMNATRARKGIAALATAVVSLTNGDTVAALANATQAASMVR